MPKTIAIVDPFCPGIMGQEFNNSGCHVIQITNSPSLAQSPGFVYNKKDYSYFLNDVTDEAKLSQKLKLLNTSAILPGCETGVYLADRLNKILKLKGNDPANSKARRHKYHIAVTAAKSGLKIPAQKCSSELNELIQWAKDFGKFPVIVKPPISIGSEDICICHSLDDVRNAFNKIYKKINQLGESNEDVLIQEFMTGNEFAIDTVSWEGKHKVTAMWRYGREADSPILNYDLMALMSYEGEVQSLLLEYTFRLLDALGLKFGPAHIELIYRNGEVYLMELGARMQGGRSTTFSRICTNNSQLDETVLAYNTPSRFLENIALNYSIKKHVTTIFLRPKEQGILIKVNHISTLKNLQSFHQLNGNNVGKFIKKFAGSINLIHQDEEIIKRDVEKIREMEQADLFVMSQEKIEPN